MCDALFVELNHELDILPGAWWSCYSDAPDSRSAMCAAIMRMLDKETGNKWRTHICPKIQELDKLTNKPYDEKYTQMHPVINHEVLYFWSQLRGQLRGLYGTHYRTLQAICSSGGTWISSLHIYSDVLHISPNHWNDCSAGGKGCQNTMATNIINMFGKFMAYVSWETFKSVAVHANMSTTIDSQECDKSQLTTHNL